jgi:hypothetical protein
VLIEGGTAGSIIGVGGAAASPEEVVLEGLNSCAAKLKVSVYFRLVSPFVDIAGLSNVDGNRSE